MLKNIEMLACSTCFYDIHDLCLVFAHRLPCIVPNPIAIIFSTALLGFHVHAVCEAVLNGILQAPFGFDIGHANKAALNAILQAPFEFNIRRANNIVFAGVLVHCVHLVRAFL